MNKRMFWSGLSMFIIQLIGILIFVLTTLNYSWLTAELIRSVIVFTCIGLFNITSIIFMIVGIFSKDERRQDDNNNN